MGMAASQARLLCITARIHDVEYQAQAIQNAKLQLATQSDEAYNEYLEALDATTLTFTTIDPASGQKSTMAATFNNLCSRNKLTAAVKGEYALRNTKGQLIVEEDIYEGYTKFNNAGLDDAYQFALYMMNGSDVLGGNYQGISEDFMPGSFDKKVYEAEEKTFEELDDSLKSDKLKNLHEDLVKMTDAKGIYCTDAVTDMDKYNSTMDAYRAE